MKEIKNWVNRRMNQQWQFTDYSSGGIKYRLWGDIEREIRTDCLVLEDYGDSLLRQIRRKRK